MQAPIGVLPGAPQPDEAMRALRQAVGLPTEEDRVSVAESLLKQSPDAKSGNPSRQLKRAYAAMLQALKENHLAEKEHLIKVSDCMRVMHCSWLRMSCDVPCTGVFLQTSCMRRKPACCMSCQRMSLPQFHRLTGVVAFAGVPRMVPNRAGLCMQACQKELSQQKAAYERAIAEILERQQPQKAKATKETAAEALRSHPLAETPPREAHTRAHACLLGDEPVSRMPVLRSRYALCSGGSCIQGITCCTV